MAIEKNPLGGTMEMMGVNPDEAESTDSVESYRDIGEAKLAKATERVKELGQKARGFMSRSWAKLKSFGSATKEAGRSALVYTLAAPQMARDASDKVQQGVIEGAEMLREKTAESIGYVADKVDEGIDTAKEMGKAAAGRAFEEVVYVSDKAREKYRNTMDSAREKWSGLKERAADAKGVFQAAVEEARRRKEARVSKELSAAFQKLDEARRTIEALSAQLNRGPDIGGDEAIA